MSLDVKIFSDISEWNKDYSDTLDFRRGWVGEVVVVVTFLVLKVPEVQIPNVNILCDVLQEKVTYVGKYNFAAEWKIAGNLKKVKFQVLMDRCSRYIWEFCTLSKNFVWFDSEWVNTRRIVCPLS